MAAQECSRAELGIFSKNNALDISNHSQTHALTWVRCLVLCLYQVAGSVKPSETKPHWLSHDYWWNELNDLYDSSIPDRTASVRPPYKGTGCWSLLSPEGFQKISRWTKICFGQAPEKASVFSSFPPDLRVKFPNLTCAGLEFSKPKAKRDANGNLYKLNYRVFITSIGSACCSIIEASCDTKYVFTSPLQSSVSRTQAIAVALYSALLDFYEGKGACINIFHGLESDFKLLCKPCFSSRLMKEMLELYSRIQSDSFTSHSMSWELILKGLVSSKH